MPGAADFGPVASQDADENFDRDPENSRGIRAQVHETGAKPIGSPSVE